MDRLHQTDDGDTLIFHIYMNNGENMECVSLDNLHSSAHRMEPTGKQGPVFEAVMN